MLQPVAVPHKHLNDLREHRRTLAGRRDSGARRATQGKAVLRLSATAFGGGVSEILYTVVPPMIDVGIEAEWDVIYGREEFFNATKVMHCIVHDPQPAALSSLVPGKSHRWVWRCHIDLSTANPEHSEPPVRSLEGSAWGDRRVPNRQGRDPRGTARAGRFDADQRSRRVGLLQRHGRACRRGPGHSHMNNLNKWGRSR